MKQTSEELDLKFRNTILQVQDEHRFENRI